MLGSNRSCQSRKQIKRFLKAAPEVQDLTLSRKARWPTIRCLAMRSGYRLGMLGWLLIPVLALGQTNQQPSAPPSTEAQPAPSQPANPKPIKPSAVAAAATASRQARDSAPPIKVIRNDDLNDDADWPETAKSEPKPSGAAAHHKSSEDKTTRDEERKVRQFYSQGLAFKNQVKVQKGKIADIQNRMTSLKNRFAGWSVRNAQDSEARACWTSGYYMTYYKDWCDTGRNLKAQYEQLQRQLAQEKAKLEQMQENIRRAGYGNAVYDPD